jgi:uncharacterized membrane protein YfcA
MDPLLVVAGLGIGLLVGMTGMGGGSLMTPILILLFGTAPTTAIGSDIAYAAVTKTVGGWRHLRLGTVNLPISFWLAVGSVPAAIAGVWTISLLHDAYGDSLDDIVLTMLAIALVAVGLLVLIRALFIPGLAASERESFELTRGHKLSAVAIGAATGFVIGITSAGSGTLIAVFLIAFYKLAPRRVVGNRRLPRRDPALGGRNRAPGERKRGLRPRGHDPARVRARDLDRQSPHGAPADGVAAYGPRGGDGGLGGRAVRQSRHRAPAGGPDRDPGCIRRGAQRPGADAAQASAWRLVLSDLSIRAARRSDLRRASPPHARLLRRTESVQFALQKAEGGLHRSAARASFPLARALGLSGTDVPTYR